MKKLIVCATIACATVVVRAATFDWVTSSAKMYGVVAANVTGNGSYGVATSGTTDRGDKVLALNYVLTILDATTDAEIGSASGTVSYGSLGKVNTGDIEVAGAEQGTTYKFLLELTGSQSNLRSRGEDTVAGYDYSAATLSTQYSGTVTTAAMGGSSLFESDWVPSAWTVSGITPIGSSGDVPEPTSGLLLVLGGSILALRRKR